MKCKLNVVAIYIIVVAVSDITGVLLIKKGWYVNEKGGTKIPITNISSVDVSNFPNTKYLKITAKLHDLPAGSVKKLESLEILKLVSCNIHQIFPGAFIELSNITEIALNDNKIKVIKSGVFNNLNLSILLLHRNKIKFIESEAFDNMTGLKKLQLNSNFIFYWDHNWFKNTPQLSELYFRRNAIRSIPGNAFKNLAESSPSTNRRIKIFLSKNYISSVEKGAFYGLNKCGQIWLDRNEIVDLDQDLFEEMEHLEVLFLSKNWLTDLPGNLFRNLKSDLVSLDLTNNKNVSCLDYELVTKVKLTNLQKIRDLDCECIERLKKKFITNGQNNEINSDC